MNVVVAMDGSTYGQWALHWVAKLPLVEPPKVLALHVLDSAWLRGPFRTRPEICAWKRARHEPSRRSQSSWRC
jgi:hypothetical protein